MVIWPINQNICIHQEEKNYNARADATLTFPHHTVSAPHLHAGFKLTTLLHQSLRRDHKILTSKILIIIHTPIRHKYRSAFVGYVYILLWIFPTRLSSHCYEEPSLLGYYATSTGKWLPTIPLSILSPFSGPVSS